MGTALLPVLTSCCGWKHFLNPSWGTIVGARDWLPGEPVPLPCSDNHSGRGSHSELGQLRRQLASREASSLSPHTVLRFCGAEGCMWQPLIIQIPGLAPEI